MNAHAERFVRSIRSECLDRMIFVVREIPDRLPVKREGDIEVTERLGGLLRSYHRRAA